MGSASYEVVGRVACFRLAGEQELEDGVHRITDAILRTKQLGLEKLLVDITAITGVEPPSVDTRYWLMGEWADAGRGSVRVAIVTRPEFIAPDRFAVIFGMNRGFINNVFETEAQALEWLHGHGGRADPGKGGAGSG
ncbi:MAG TPA: hypothetical protein VFK00_08285 [Rhodanobacteraceae bacterium]|jgi:hypothetical protein|nr:hypothetical protein [Rhodanobacteraceae bacterium]